MILNATAIHDYRGFYWPTKWFWRRSHILACLKNGNWTPTGHFSGENDDWPWFTMMPWFIIKLWLIVFRQKHFLLPIVAGPKSQWLPAPLDRSFEPVRLLDAKSTGSHIFGVQETWFPVDLPLNVLNQSIVSWVWDSDLQSLRSKSVWHRVIGYSGGTLPFQRTS